MEKKGIWLDKEKALIVSLTDQQESLTKIDSNIEHFRIHGGSGTKMKGGPQDVVQDSKYLEREKHQFRAYFKELIQEVKNADSIVIFGPAEAPEKFKKEIDEHYKDVSTKVKGVERADSMTDNQVKAWVRDFYKNS